MISILTDNLPRYELSGISWYDILKLASFFGWEPAGTFCLGAGPHWNGEYFYDRWYTVQVGRADAAALAEALLRAVSHIPAVPTPPEEVRRVVSGLLPRTAVELSECNRTISRLSETPDCIREFVRLCGHAPLRLAPSDAYAGSYCHCGEPWLPVAEEHRRLPYPTGSDWLPDPGFPLWLVLRAVRSSLEGACHGRHLHSRAGLAQAICGHLDERPADKALSDDDLLVVVARRYYGVHTTRELEAEDEDGRGWSQPLRDAFERLRADGPPVRQSLNDAAPWWRASHIIGGAEVELAAAVTEQLWRRRREVSCSGNSLGWGRHVAVALPAVNLATTQHVAFGPDHTTWPLPDADPMHLALSDRVVPDLLWRVAGRSQTEVDVTSDLESWERLSGLSEEQMFPERGTC